MNDEDLDKAAKEFVDTLEDNDLSSLLYTFKAGANWQKEREKQYREAVDKYMRNEKKEREY